MTSPRLTPVITATSTSSPRPQALGAALSQPEIDVSWDTQASVTEIRNQCISRILRQLDDDPLPEGGRVAVVIGSQCSGDNPATDRYYPASPQGLVQNLLPAMEVTTMVVSHACASTGMAVGIGADLCRTGRADAVIVCASSIDGPLEEDTFRDTRAWTDEIRPFDESASGTRVYGFAGALLIRGLREARPGDIVVRSWAARSIGGKTNSDPQEELRVMTEAAERAQLNPTLVVAHATGTRQGDAAELEALESLIRTRKLTLDVLANKGAIGHGVFAAGLASVVTAARALQGVPVYGTYGLRRPARQINNLTFLEESSANHAMNLSHHASALVNSFGFSGSNVALVLERKIKMNTPDVADFVRAEAARINEESYDHVTITDDTVLADDLDIDSLALMELCIRVEEVYQVPIADDEAGSIRTVGSLREHIKSHGKG
ncbi:phosphopantetheine-binding protein [Auritidibacter ignavus]|uniref:phosphopantetheine-binding protein n=1 Tax=Auritidibacter ignavus TaxID=678932 RepID=UPI00109D0A4F|nr:phosphopantetheine-binding protein [Auritidibacter ignavus]